MAAFVLLHKFNSKTGAALQNTHRPEERLLDLLGKNVEHVNRLSSQGKIGARNPLVLSQLGLAALLLLLKCWHRNLTPFSSAPDTYCKMSQLKCERDENIPQANIITTFQVLPTSRLTLDSWSHCSLFRISSWTSWIRFRDSRLSSNKKVVSFISMLM